MKSTWFWPTPTWSVARLFVADILFYDLDKIYLVGGDKQSGISGISWVWWPLDQHGAHDTSSS